MTIELKMKATNECGNKKNPVNFCSLKWHNRMKTASRVLSPVESSRGEEGGEIGSIFIMSIVLGILVVPTVVYGQRPESDLDAVNIVTGINVTVRLLSAVTLVVAFTAIRNNMQEWVNDKSSNMIIKTKLVFIWIFGFAKMKLNLTVKYVSINANEFMLLLSTIGVMSYMSMQAFYQRDVDGILTSLIVISLPFILYQVIIILFGRRVDLIGNEISAVHSIQQLVLILGCQNIAVWFNDFLYGVWDMSNDHILRHSVFKYIALMLYPLLAYYRFQSAMELMQLYRHVS
uniref:Uncharacterized protein n=1 Tax=Magallana gigas TaxID=29159 RepID=K1Q4A7_MAGGI